jgi:OTU domain-containing protein 6
MLLVNRRRRQSCFGRILHIRETNIAPIIRLDGACGATRYTAPSSIPVLMAGSKKNKLKKALSPPNVSFLPPRVDEEQDELMNDLLAQLDSRDETVQFESANVLNEMQLQQQADEIEAGGKQTAKSRFQARQVTSKFSAQLFQDCPEVQSQARKAAALAQTYAPDDSANDERLEREAKDEERDIDRVCHDLLLQVHEVSDNKCPSRNMNMIQVLKISPQINPDGHCLFSAIADQLVILDLLPSAQANYANIRQTAAQYMFSHPNDFIPFLPSVGEDTGGNVDGGIMSLEGFERYCASIRDTAVWGGEPEILALSRAFDVPIHVIQGGHPPIVVHNPREGPINERHTVRISYHRKMYGLGEVSHFMNFVGRLNTSSILLTALQLITPERAPVAAFTEGADDAIP